MVENPAITARNSLSEGLNSAIPIVGSIFCGFPQENGDFPETVSSSATGIATRDESGSLAATLLQSPLTQG